MRKLLLNMLCLLAVCISTNSYAAGRTYIYDRWYAVDTLQCSKVGPGTQFSSIKFTSEDNALVFRTFFLHVDVDNPNLRIKSELGHDTIIGGETVRAHAQRHDAPNNFYIAGTNGDFYTTTVPVGIPIYGSATDGQISTPALGGAPCIVISDNTTPWCSAVTQRASMKVNGGSAININRVNGNRYTNELVLYNSLNGKYTHTSAGGKEIAVQLTDGAIWKINSPVKVKVVGNASSTGNMPIASGQAVLSADGSSMSVIESLKEGDEIEFNFNQTLDSYNGITPNITQIMGGNPFLVMNGEVVPQGDMARHPRTMMGYTKDQKQFIMCVLDGRSTISSGGIYLELADVMKYAGAYWAMNNDGGGSSTMYVRNLGIMNHPSDGAERSVSNGMYLVLETPEDNEIASIEFKDWAMKFPKYGTYTPVFYGFNKYGMLINSDVQGVELSCDARLGKIENGTKFIGDGEGTYALEGTYKGIKTAIPVTVEESDNVSIRLKKIITDGIREYPVEVQATMNEAQMPISPSALKWNSDDAAIVKIDENTGILKGVANGTTAVHGAVGHFEGSLQVVVEKPTVNTQAIDENLNVATWKITQTGGKNMVATAMDNGMKLSYTGASGRAPNIKLVKALQLWSIPDKIRIRINPGDAVIKKITLSLRPNEGSVQNVVIAENLVPNVMTELNLPTSQWCNADDMINYPIYLNNILLDMGTSTTGKEYTIEIPGIEAVYDGVESGSVEQIGANDADNVIKISENVIILSESASNIEVFDMIGAKVKSGTNTMTLSAPEASGAYIVKCTINGKAYMKKFIK